MDKTILLVPTGDIIRGYLEANKVTEKQVAEKAGCKKHDVSLVICNKARLTQPMADALAVLLPGNKADFWMTYDKKYVQQQKETKSSQL